MYSKMKYIKNANVVLEDGIIFDGAIILDGDKIVKADYMSTLEVPSGAEIIDAKGAYVGPGFVDIHVHGALDAGILEKPAEIAEHFLKHGETTILPTSSGAIGTFDDFMEILRNAKSKIGSVKNIKGIYMEGPYVNPGYGAGKKISTWYKEEFTEEKYKALVDELGTLVKVWCIAPEREDLIPFMEHARKVNPDVVFSVCHSEATPQQIRNLGRKFRPKLITHMMNATGRQTGGGGIRGYGPDEYCLSDPDMYAELISDFHGVHVHSDLQRMIVKNKGVHRVVLITDSTYYRYGNRPEKFARFEDIDDLNFNEVGSLSGSKLTMDQACRNIMKHTNCGIAQAFVMASLNPAKVIGMDDEIGSIEPGKTADLVFIDDRFNVKKVMVGGEICRF